VSKIKYTLSSQEYNEMFRNAAASFDEEMVKRDIAIKNMTKKLMIINYANEFIENQIASLNGTIDYEQRLVTFNNEKYILILDKNSDIQTNIHHIKTNFNIIKVQDYKDDFGLVYYKTLIN
jgi:hypothetical protein